jgi:hypothetical protein
VAQLLPAAELHATLRDETDSRAAWRVSLRPSTAPAAAAAAAVDLLNRLDALSGCSPTGFSIVYPYHVSDAPASGPQQRHQVALFVFRCDGVDQWLTLTVPGIAETYITATPGRVIDTAATPIVNLVQAVIDGQFCNPFGYQVVALETAFVQFVP